MLSPFLLALFSYTYVKSAFSEWKVVLVGRRRAFLRKTNNVSLELGNYQVLQSRNSVTNIIHLLSFMNISQFFNFLIKLIRLVVSTGILLKVPRRIRLTSRYTINKMCMLPRGRISNQVSHQWRIQSLQDCRILSYEIFKICVFTGAT